jgi:hypothetical protein
MSRISSNSSGRLSQSAHAARGDALESKYRGQGMSESDIKTKLASMNNGQAKGADGKESAASGSVSSSNTSSTTSLDSASAKSLLETILKAVGIDSSKISEVLGSIANKSSSAVSSASAGTGYSAADSFESGSSDE